MKKSEEQYKNLSIFLALIFLGFVFWQLKVLKFDLSKSEKQTNYYAFLNKQPSLDNIASNISSLSQNQDKFERKNGGDLFSPENKENKNLETNKRQNKITKKDLITAKEAFAFGIKSGKIYYKKNIYTKRPIASLTKLMTALIFYDYFPKGYQVVVSKRASDIRGCFLADLKQGQVFKKEDILYLMLLISSNQAAYVAQESIPNFLSLMNKKAKLLGMSATLYKEPSGLSASNQSTVFDLSKLLEYIYQNRPEIFKIQTTKTKVVCSLNNNAKEKKCYHLVNIDFFVNRKDFLGGKTGYTDEAGQCLASIFKWKEPLGIIVLDSEDRFVDSEKILNMVERKYK